MKEFDLKKVQAKAKQNLKKLNKCGKNSNIDGVSPFLALDDMKSEQRRKALQAQRITGSSKSLDQIDMIELTRNTWKKR